jgi:hypothetical protein
MWSTVTLSFWRSMSAWSSGAASSSGRFASGTGPRVHRIRTVTSTPTASRSKTKTLWTPYSPDGARLLARTLLAEALVNLELHAIDFLGSDDGLDGLAKHQPDVRVPFVRKIAALTAVVELLRSKGFGFVRLDEAARASA